MKKTLAELVRSTNKRVYVHLADQETLQAFIIQAEKEGFTFSGGKRISDMPTDDFYALDKNLTVNYINFVGRMAYQCNADHLYRVEFKKYLSE